MTQTPEELGRKIKEAQTRNETPDSGFSVMGRGTDDSKGAATALRAATDIVAAVGVGAFLGYWMDQWLGWKPFCMIAMIFVGFIAGFMNIYRSQTKKTDNKG